jgi:hypothetical protein
VSALPVLALVHVIGGSLDYRASGGALGVFDAADVW